jgi:hypothetical protein
MTNRNAMQYETLPTGWRAINPARRAKKATGLRGRQWVKHRKAEARGRGPMSRDLRQQVGGCSCGARFYSMDAAHEHINGDECPLAAA